MIYQGRDDGAEGGPDNYRDGKVQNITAHNEIFKLFKHSDKFKKLTKKVCRYKYNLSWLDRSYADAVCLEPLKGGFYKLIFGYSSPLVLQPLVPYRKFPSHEMFTPTFLGETAIAEWPPVHRQ